MSLFLDILTANISFFRKEIYNHCYGKLSFLSHQDEDDNELFYEVLRDISRSSDLVHMGDLNFLDVNWEYHKADTNRSRKFLKHTGDNFLV